MLWEYRTHRRRRLYSRCTVYRRMKGFRGKNKRDNNRSQYLKYKNELVEVPLPLPSLLSSRNGPWMQSWPVTASPLAQRLIQGWAGLSQFTQRIVGCSLQRAAGRQHSFSFHERARRSISNFLWTFSRQMWCLEPQRSNDHAEDAAHMEKAKAGRMAFSQLRAWEA